MKPHYKLVTVLRGSDYLQSKQRMTAALPGWTDYGRALRYCVVRQDLWAVFNLLDIGSHAVLFVKPMRFRKAAA